MATTSTSQPPKPTRSLVTPLAARTILLLSGIVAAGTAYSIVYDTAQDTSHPLTSYHASHSRDLPYLARKNNIFNVWFVKLAWGWTTAAFFAVFFTAPPSSVEKRTKAFVQWAAGHVVWAAFTFWFFGPSLFDRVLGLTGAQCVVVIPPTGPNSGMGPTSLSVPYELCRTKKSIVSPSSHPSVFAELPGLALSSLTTAANAVSSETSLKFKPRLYHGHDISGHLFLLTLSILILVDTIAPALRSIQVTKNPSRTSKNAEEDKPAASALHVAAVYFAIALTGLWCLMVLTTSIYFHVPLEKLSGFAAGLAGYLFTVLVA